jgi:hypothetical protein
MTWKAHDGSRGVGFGSGVGVPAGGCCEWSAAETTATMAMASTDACLFMS